MKYCPYCGASVLDDTVSFCSECGKRLNHPDNHKEERAKPQKTDKRKAGNTAQLKQKKLKASETELVEPDKERKKSDDGYDGYYDDIVPTDTGKLREGVDWVLMKKIGLVGVIVVVIICLCIAAMYLL